jgi:hypothetical protein
MAFYFVPSSGSWEKNKRYAEQAAALVAIACLGLDDEIAKLAEKAVDTNAIPVSMEKAGDSSAVVEAAVTNGITTNGSLSHSSESQSNISMTSTEARDEFSETKALCRKDPDGEMTVITDTVNGLLQSTSDMLSNSS